VTILGGIVVLSRTGLSIGRACKWLPPPDRDFCVTPEQ